MCMSAARSLASLLGIVVRARAAHGAAVSDFSRLQFIETFNKLPYRVG